MRRYHDIAYTESVLDAQTHGGARAIADRMAKVAFADDRLTSREAGFIAQRDGFYIGTTNQDGWPYIQFRGGEPGFLKVLDDRTVAFADLRGNRQFLTTGNLRHDSRVSLFLMDYANRRRLKIFGRAAVIDRRDDPERIAALADAATEAIAERALIITVEAFDWNCPQHIPRRFTLDEIADREAHLHARIAELEDELQTRRAAH